MKARNLSTLFIPGIILQSVLIGGGFATGREIVEYGGKFGPSGVVSGIFIFLGFTIMGILTIEICRVHAVYDYKSLLKILIGKAWFLYEIVYLALAILIIAVMASAAGEILQNIFGLNYWVGVTAVVILVALINLKGESFLVKMKTIGTIALFAAYTLFGISVFLLKKDAIFTSFELPTPDFSVGTLTLTGILYVGYNLAVYPAALFAVKGISSRRDSIISGLIAGLLMTIPWFLTFIALMGYYPEQAVFTAPVPWLEMLKPFGTAYIFIFGIVVGWTLVETATGMIHGFLVRLEEDVKQKYHRPMKSSRKALIAILILVSAILLSQFGIIDLIAKGYSVMAYAVIAIYAVPLLVKGSITLFSK